MIHPRFSPLSWPLCRPCIDRAPPTTGGLTLGGGGCGEGFGGEFSPAVQVTALTGHVTGRYLGVVRPTFRYITVYIDYNNQRVGRVVTQISHRGKLYLPLSLSYFSLDIED